MVVVVDMADAPLLGLQGGDDVLDEASADAAAGPVPITVPRSFSYRLDAGNDLLGSRRSSAASLFSSRLESTNSLLSIGRDSGAAGASIDGN